MPPPTRPNPLSKARAEFLNEPPPAYYFPKSGQEGPFSPNYSGEQIAQSRLDTAKYHGELDNYETDRVKNYSLRNTLGMDNRLMPYTESARRASLQGDIRREEVAGRLAPQMEEAATLRVESDVDRMTREKELAPQAAKLDSLRVESEIERHLTGDPTEDELVKWTRNPGDLMAYRKILNRQPKTIPRITQQQTAWRRAMRIVQDREAIAELREAEANGDISPEALSKLIQIDMDDNDGEFFGEYIVPDREARAIVEQTRAKNAIRRESTRRAYDEAMASRMARDSNTRRLNDLLREARSRYEENKGDTEAKADMDKYYELLKRDADSDGPPMAAPAGPVAPTPANNEAKPVESSQRARLWR